jgi:hypothetical protein
MSFVFFDERDTTCDRFSMPLEAHSFPTSPGDAQRPRRSDSEPYAFVPTPVRPPKENVFTRGSRTRDTNHVIPVMDDLIGAWRDVCRRAVWFECSTALWIVCACDVNVQATMMWPHQPLQPGQAAAAAAAAGAGGARGAIRRLSSKGRPMPWRRRGHERENSSGSWRHTAT